MTQCMSWPSGFNYTHLFSHSCAVLLWLLQDASLTWLRIMLILNPWTKNFVSVSGVTASQSLSVDILYLEG